MKKNFKTSFALFLLTTYYFLLAVTPVFALTAEDLRRAIEDKAKILLDVNNQIQATQKQLEQAQGQQKTLSKEIKSFDYNINQLNLGIKSSQINIEKLSLELQELQLDINKINGSIGNRKLTLMKFLRQLYEKDHEGSLVPLLKNRSLAESIRESETISSLNQGIASEVANLIVLNEELESKFQSTGSKKKNIEIENQNLKNRKGIVEDQKQDRQKLLTQTKNQERAYALLLDDLAKKQAEISEEIEKIEDELRSKIDPSILPIPRPGVLAMPTRGILSQNYGETDFARSGYRGHFHNGIDIAAPIGAEVWAAEEGTIIASGDQDRYCKRGAYGKFVVVKHSNNLTTLYAHLSKIAVSNGAIISRGDVIGYVGRTGYATGPHLHFTVYAGPTFYMGASRVCGSMPFGGYLNPMDYVSRN